MNEINIKKEIETNMKLFGFTREESIKWIKDECLEKINKYSALLVEAEEAAKE